MQAVRAEIKTWEKSFKAENGRDPTVDDIKAQPDVANKYRLYKRLAKEAAGASAPTTPPKVPVLLPSSSRVAETTASLAAFNPFSPVKKQKKRSDPISALPDTTAHNPFSTPNSKRALSTSPCEPSTSTQPDAPLSPLAPVSAVSRARKRLRGEPVSPSPNKEKRPRVLSYLDMPMPTLDLSNTDEDAIKPDMMEPEPGSTIIGDSPVKPPAGSKSFTTLFQESLPPLVLEPKDNAPPQTKSSIDTPVNQPVNTLPSFDEELGWLKANRVTQGKTKQPPLVQKSKKGKAAMKPPISEDERVRELHVPLKRPLSDTEPDAGNSQFRPKICMPPLLPPSPPPEPSESASFASKSKLKPNPSMNSRKRAKISKPNVGGEDSSEGTDDDPDSNFKVIDATSRRPKRAAQGDDAWDEDLESDPDPILTYAFLSRAQGSPRGINPTLDTESNGDLDVDLPDNLREVLALDMLDTKARDRHEKRVVERLLYNRRTTHYESDKGGEIWGVGEDSHIVRIGLDGELEVQPDTDGDDEWEGEPVPWEVAEL